MPPSVVVTGAGRGIGLAITERMSARGWDVYATARAAEALDRLERLPNVHPISLDITDHHAIVGLADRLPAALNGVVNNAGVIVSGPVEGLSLDALSRQLDVKGCPPNAFGACTHPRRIEAQPLTSYPALI